MTNRTTTILILALLILNSCKAPEAYRNALEAFSQGAKLEMNERFPPEDATSGAELPNDFIFFDDLYKASGQVNATMAFSKYYQKALEAANTALKGESQLKKHNMLDNTYAIKALTQWRQGNYEEANTLASQAEPLLSKDNGGEDDVRDLAMMQALPGLINIEKAYLTLADSKKAMDNLAEISNQGPEERHAAYNKVKAIYEKSVTDDTDGAASISRGLALIQRAIDNVDNNDAIVLYLRNAQLASMDTWGDMLVNVFTTSRRLSVSQFAPNEATWISDERQEYEKLMNDYMSNLAEELPGGEDNKLYLYWKKVL